MNKNIDRRSFLKIGSTVATTSVLGACTNKNGTNIDLDPAGHHTDEVPVDKMTTRTIPRTGEQVSLLGFGCMRFPKKDKKDNDTPHGGEIDQEETNHVIKYALDHGLTLFDTSPAYCRGMSEEALGNALVASGYPRDKYFISTKLSNFASQQWSFEEGKAMFERSLQYLQTDYVDFLLLHSIGGSMDNLRQRYLDNGLLDWMVEQRELGRTHNLGFSFHGDVAVYDWMLSQHEKYHWDFVLIQLNYLDWHNEEKGKDAEYLYNELAKRNIPVLVMEPLLGGRLSKVPDHVVAHLKKRRPEDSVASWGFRYAATKPMVLSVLSGMTYLEHLEDNIRTFSPLQPLTEEEERWLDGETASLIEAFPTIPCTECRYCMPCPYGLDIPGIFLHYNKCVNTGNVPENQQATNYEQARKVFLRGYDRAVPKLRQADHCTNCGKCVSHCPQHIDIPKEMRHLDKFIEKLKTNTL